MRMLAASSRWQGPYAWARRWHVAKQPEDLVQEALLRLYRQRHRYDWTDGGWAADGEVRGAKCDKLPAA